jgi:hypothetical protein
MAGTGILEKLTSLNLVSPDFEPGRIVRSNTARSSCAPPPSGVISIRVGTPRSTSKCVCNRHFTKPLPVVRFKNDACISRGKAASNVPSTAASAPGTSFSRGSRPSGFSSAPSSSTISCSRLGSNTATDSDSEPSAAREQPNRFCTLANSLACCKPRSDVTIGLNKYNRISRQY